MKLQRHGAVLAKTRRRRPSNRRKGGPATGRLSIIPTEFLDNVSDASASLGAAMSGAVITAQLIGQDRAQAGDIIARSRSPVFALCRALLAAGANPNSKLECFRGSVLALTVKTIGIGAKLTIKENDWVGPKVVPYKPFSRDRVGRHVRQNDDPAPPPLSDVKSPVEERNGD